LRSHTELDGHGAYIPVAQPVPYDLFQITAPVNRQNRKPGDPCHTLARDNAAHAAIAIQGNLVGRETGGPQGVGASTDGAMYTLTKADTHAVAFGTDCYNGAITGNVAATMGTPGSSVNASGPTVMQAVAFKPGQSASAHSIGAQEGVACTLEAGGGGNNKQAVAFDWQSGGDSRGLDPKDTAQLQRCQTPAVHHAMTVRRLTPVECERLQGFPDNWTLIPWRKKPAEECPDGPRYKALGNSMACNCMALIGERIAAYEQRGRVDPTPAGTAGIAPAGDLNHEGDRHG
jgi:DNA (cytosine-5)-methyltransferase 1